MHTAGSSLSPKLLDKPSCKSVCRCGVHSWPQLDWFLYPQPGRCFPLLASVCKLHHQPGVAYDHLPKTCGTFMFLAPNVPHALVVVVERTAERESGFAPMRPPKCESLDHELSLSLCRLISLVVLLCSPPTFKYPLLHCLLTSIFVCAVLFVLCTLHPLFSTSYSLSLCTYPPSSPQPVARAVSLTALAIAGCGGLFFAAESGALVSWGLPYFKPWQVHMKTSSRLVLVN